MKKYLLIFICVFAGGYIPLRAQVIVEETITTDTIDIFARAEERAQEKKSPRLAMFGNLLIPGLGHQYIGRNNRAFTYLATESLLIFGMVFSEGYSRKMYRNSRSYAWRYANTTCTREPENEYWKIIGNKHFLSSDEYNNVMELNAEYDEKYVEENERWYWEHEDYQKEYRGIRQNATRFHIVSSFFLGAMILNRVISFIDVRIASKDETIRGTRSAVDVQPHYSLADKEVGVSVSADF